MKYVMILGITALLIFAVVHWTWPSEQSELLFAKGSGETFIRLASILRFQ